MIISNNSQAKMCFDVLNISRICIKCPFLLLSENGFFVDLQACKEQQDNIEVQSRRIITALYCSVMGDEVTSFSCFII